VSTEDDFSRLFRALRQPQPKGHYEVFIIRDGTPRWHQFVDTRDSEIQADFAVRCALDMSGARLGYVKLNGRIIRYYGPSRQGICSSVRPVACDAVDGESDDD
jgi:hypothetical protein